jgi:hypothetical protein
MIALPRKEMKTFHLGDMRDFNLEKQVDAIIITGRSTSYLTTNDDLNETFASLFNNITEEGIIVFDFIDANRFIPYINENHHTQAEYELTT